MTDEKILELVVMGPAQQQGSVTAFVPQRNGEPLRRPGGSIVVNVTSDNKELKAWRKGVAALAREALDAGPPLAFPYDGRSWPLAGVGFTVSEVAYFRRPKSHFGTGRNAHLVKDSAPARPIVASKNADSAPDVDKLLRAALDALTGVVWADDAQVTDGMPRKRYVADPRGVLAVLQVWINGQQTAADLPIEERHRDLLNAQTGDPMALRLT